MKALEASILSDRDQPGESGAWSDLREKVRSCVEADAYGEAESLLCDALAPTSGPAPVPEVRIRLSLHLASLYFILGNFVEANPLFERSRGLVESLQREGAVDPELLYELAVVSQQRGRWRQAVELYEQAIAAAECSPALGAGWVLSALHRLSRLWYEADCFERALEAEERLQTLLRASDPPDPDALANSQRALSILHAELENLGEAEAWAREALSTWAAHRPQPGGRVVLFLTQLAYARLLSNQDAEAEGLLRDALAQAEADSGAQEYVEDIRQVFAYLHYWRGDYAAAEEAYRRVLRELGWPHGGHPGAAAVVLHRLGAMYREQSRESEAGAFFHLALEAAQRAYPADHPALVPALTALSERAREEDELSEALAMLQRAYQILCSALGSDHPRTRVLAAELAYDLARAGEVATALKLAEELTHEMPELFSARDEDSREVMGFLYRMLMHLERYAEAEPMAARYLELLREEERSVDWAVAGALWNLALCYEYTGRTREAIPLLREATELWRKTSGVASPDVVNSLSFLGSLHAALGEYENALDCFREAMRLIGSDESGELTEHQEETQERIDWLVTQLDVGSG